MPCAVLAAQVRAASRLVFEGGIERKVSWAPPEDARVARPFAAVS